MDKHNYTQQYQHHCLQQSDSVRRLSSLYPSYLKKRYFGLAKALGLDDLKWFHISNIEPFIVPGMNNN